MSSRFSAWLKGSRGEQGQAMVMAAFAMVVILGFGAFAVDIGHVAVQKSDLQNAADAAALAGVVEMPLSANAVSTAVNYAKINGMDVAANNVTLNGEKVYATAIGTKQLRVECSREVDYYFAGVLGFESKVVTAVAVAEKNSSSWSGEALPFVNTNILFSLNGQFDVRDKAGYGSFDSIQKDDRGEKLKAGYWAFDVAWEDGLLAKKGMDNSVHKEVQDIYDDLVDAGGTRTVYMFSLSNTVIQSGNVKISTIDKKTGKETISTIKISKIGTADNIHVSQLVLLKCTFDVCEDNSKTIKLTTKGVYDLGNDVLDPKGNNYSDFPTDFESEDGSGAGAKLIQ
jgi:Flp pilus assembly protein TadG